MTVPTTTRRLLGAAVTLALAVLPLAACSDSGESADGRIQLRMAWWGNADRAAITEQAIEAFEQAHPDIDVQTEPSDFAGYFDKLATSTAARDAPDVFTLGGAYPAEYAGRGALLDLSTVRDQLDLSGLDASAVQNGQVQGRQVSVPTGSNALAVVVNPKVFAAAGVAVPDPATWTWADFEQIASEISEASPSGTFGSASVLTHDSLDAFARQRGEQLYTRDGGLGLGQDTVADFFALSKRLTDSGAAPSAQLQVEQTGVSNEQTLMGQGKAAMMLTWSNSLASLSTASGEPLQLLGLPGESPTPGIWLQSSQYYSISATSRHPEAAAQLVDFLVNDPGAGTTLGTDRGVPANPALREAIEPDLGSAGKAELAYIGEVSRTDFAPTFIGPVGSTAVSDVTNRANQEVVFGRLSPQDAAARWMGEARQAIGS